MIFPGAQGYHAEISKSSSQHRKLRATWGSAGPVAQLARCSERYLRGRGVLLPVGRGRGAGGRKDRLSILALRIDLLNVCFALMQTRSKLYTFELVALSFPDFCRASKSAKKIVGSSSISIFLRFLLCLPLRPFVLKNKHHLFFYKIKRPGCLPFGSLSGDVAIKRWPPREHAKRSLSLDLRTARPPVWLSGPWGRGEKHLLLKGIERAVSNMNPSLGRKGTYPSGRRCPFT